MKIQIKGSQQHSLSKIQVSREPVKEVQNPFTNKSESWEYLRGLSWTLFEEDRLRCLG